MLARLVVQGFERMENKMETLATKDELKETEGRIMEKLNDRCDRIEFIPLRDQNNRLERLEDKVRRMETALEMG